MAATVTEFGKGTAYISFIQPKRTERKINILGYSLKQRHSQLVGPYQNDDICNMMS